MSNFARKKNHGYVVVDFNNVTKQGLKKLIAALKRAGSPVTDVAADNKKSRKDSVQVKKAKFFFENGQSMTLFIGSEGDIYQLALNAAKQPLPDTDSDRELATHMSKLMQRNQAKFDKAQARKAKKAISQPTTSKPLSRSVSARLQAANAILGDMQTNHQQLTATRDQVKSTVDESQTRISELQSELSAEKAETAELEQQLKELS